MGRKRIIALFLALLLTLSCTGALAVRNPYIGVMRVVNCDEWASLRLEPYEYTERLAKVPLGALVYAYYEDKEFTRCYYDGYGWGYIKNEYLALEELYEPTAFGSVEQAFGESDFWQLYPDYQAFYSPYASTSHTGGWREATYLFSAGSATYTVANCDGWVSLRREADSQSGRILAVPLGADVYVNGIWHGWGLCLYEGRAGWIKMQYLSLSDPYFTKADEAEYLRRTGGDSAPDAVLSIQYVVNCDEWVSLRQFPDTGADRLREVPLGARVEVMELCGDFAGVYYDGMYGYILRDYLASVPPYMDGDDEIEDPGYYLGDMYVVNCDEWVSLREWPDTSSARLAAIPLGTRLTAYQVDTRFAIVTYNGIVGYVLLDYLGKEPPTPPAGEVLTPQYSAWSGWGDTPVTASSTRQVETRTVYGYYYYSCPACGNHVHVYDYGDPTWCGGCGYTGSLEGGWNYVFTDTYYDYNNPAATLSDWQGTGRYYYNDPSYGRLFAWIHSGNPAPYGKTQYRYRDRIN